MSQRGAFRFNLPHVSSTTLRAVGVYLSGAFYAAGFYAMLDTALFSSHDNASVVHVKFTDWIPFILSSLGMMVINTVEKSRLSSESFSFGSSNGYSSADWQARVVLFMGFAMLAAGLSGSVVVLILRYIVPHYPWPTLGMGVGNVVSNAAVMLSCISLWLSQNLEDEYSYSLQL